MAASEVEIANLALRHLAVSTTIQSLTERSKEARAMNAFYEQVRDEVLRDSPWPFATTIDDLALVETDPNDEWGYRYAYPSDAMMFRRILSGARTDVSASRVPYRIISDGAAKFILAGTADAQGEWTTKITDPTLYAPDFVEAMALLLAGYAGPSVTGGDKAKLADRALQLYDWAIKRARANAYNEEQPDVEPGSTFESARL